MVDLIIFNQFNFTCFVKSYYYDNLIKSNKGKSYEYELNKYSSFDIVLE